MPDPTPRDNVVLHYSLKNPCPADTEFGFTATYLGDPSYNTELVDPELSFDKSTFTAISENKFDIPAGTVTFSVRVYINNDPGTVEDSKIGVTVVPNNNKQYFTNGQEGCYTEVIYRE